MAKVSDLRLDAAAQLPEAPYPVVDRAILRAARDLADAAPVWRVQLDDISLKDSTGEYDLALPASAYGGEIVMPVRNAVRYDGHPLPALTQEEADAHWGDWRTDEGPKPGRYVMLGPRRIAVLPVPESDLSTPLQVGVQVRPAYSAKDIDDSLALDYREGIVHGALWYMMSQPQEVWSNMQAATYHRGLFLQTRGKAMSDHARGFQRGSNRVRPRAFLGDTKAITGRTFR